jgi:hypothetical protein
MSFDHFQTTDITSSIIKTETQITSMSKDIKEISLALDECGYALVRIAESLEKLLDE